MDKKRFYILITKSQSEKLTKSEQKELNRLLESNPEFRKDADFVSKFWSETEFSAEADGDGLFRKISNEINDNPVIPLLPERPLRKRNIGNQFTLYRAAATIVFFIVMGLLAWFVVQHIRNNKQEIVAKAQVKQVERAVSKGQRLRLFLPDGTMVWLNSESKITYPDRFDGNTRLVVLEGEAFFDVTKNPEKPFIVKSGALTTTALGTSFNVRAYSPEKRVSVMLVTGKVLVELDKANDKKFLLDPGFGVQYSKTTGKITKEKRDIDKITDWKDGILRFDNDDFEMVLRKLSRWYGVEFAVVGPGKIDKNWKYTGWFKNDYLDIVLSSMSFTKNFEYRIDNKKVTLKFN